MKKLALIIEDDQDLAAIFAEALRGIDFEVENVTDGMQARERLTNAEAPFLILLDMHLPRVSGQELLKTIKNDGRFAGTWTIITTADARLAEVLSSPSSIQSACDILIKEANRNGGKDNITCVLVRSR